MAGDSNKALSVTSFPYTSNPMLFLYLFWEEAGVGPSQYEYKV